jgi:sulfatase modifying factor 1
MKSFLSPIVLVALALPALASVTMDWVDVGNPGNAADPLTGYGAVGYAYQIGKYEVTNAQYGEFLNAKGRSNDNGIYYFGMSSYGITQSSISGSFSYTVTTALANHPVVYVSWFDAARFANWMMNGQGSGDMETGAYTINGATSGIILANAGAQIYIPSENEWYKAAYYKAATTSYSLYPNGQNTITTGDANYWNGDPSYWNGHGYPSASTDVGTYLDHPSSYGTLDQGGNAWEWNDSATEGTYRGLRGGSWPSTVDQLSSSFSMSQNPEFGDNNVGFRLASVPEPTSILLTMLAGGVMLIRRKC